jgi:hypothetical protein
MHNYPNYVKKKKAVSSLAVLENNTIKNITILMVPTVSNYTHTIKHIER